MTHDEALQVLYETLVAKRAAGPKTIRDLPEDQRRAYMREKKAESRARHREASYAGHAEPTASSIRDTLADAALMILATDAPGSEQIVRVIGQTFPHMPGLPMTVAQKAKSGRLKPKMLLQAE